MTLTTVPARRNPIIFAALVFHFILWRWAWAKGGAWRILGALGIVGLAYNGYQLAMNLPTPIPTSLAGAKEDGGVAGPAT